MRNVKEMSCLFHFCRHYIGTCMQEAFLILQKFPFLVIHENLRPINLNKITQSIVEYFEITAP